MIPDIPAYDEGYQAYWDGQDRDDNPYDMDLEPEKYDAWDHGWFIARKDDCNEDD